MDEEVIERNREQERERETMIDKVKERESVLNVTFGHLLVLEATCNRYEIFTLNS